MIEPYIVHQISELRLIQDTVPIGIDTLELGCEVSEEFFMLAELEVKDALQEDVELEL